MGLLLQMSVKLEKVNLSFLSFFNLWYMSVANSLVNLFIKY